LKTRRRVHPAVVATIAAILTISLVVVPFLLKNNQEAQILFNLVVVIVTTLISVYFSLHSARAQSQDELTRYGLQAWRNLDSLSVKVSKQLGRGAADERSQQEWLLDVDQAKLAWRDLLREVFELQSRIEAETEEIAYKYKLELAEAKTPADRLQLEQKQAIEIAKKQKDAPLPLKVPVKVTCPKCESEVVGLIGQNSGDTAWLLCDHCNVPFGVQRVGESIRVGSTFFGPDQDVALLLECPACKERQEINVPATRQVEFGKQCRRCKAYIAFKGNASNFEVSKRENNSAYKCPYCESENRVWVAPGKSVRFYKTCEACRQVVSLTGSSESLVAAMR